jgi:hypothetical protein
MMTPIDDPRREAEHGPNEKPTVEIEAAPPWAIAIARDVRFIRGDVEVLTGDMTTLKRDVRDLQRWKLDVESIPVTPTMTSTGVKALIDGHPSQTDLANEAKLGLALAALAEEKAKREALEAVAVTKSDVKDVVSEATAAQTIALVTQLSQNKKLQVIGGMLLTLALGYLGRVATAPKDPAPTVQMLSPVTIYADAGTR